MSGRRLWPSSPRRYCVSLCIASRFFVCPVYLVCIPAELSPSPISFSRLHCHLLQFFFCLPLAAMSSSHDLSTLSPRSASLSHCRLVLFFFLIFERGCVSPLHSLSPSPLSSPCSSAFHLDLPSCLRRTQLDPGRARCELPCQVLSSLVSLIAFNEPARFGFEQCAMCHAAEEGAEEGGGGKRGKTVKESLEC